MDESSRSLYRWQTTTTRAFQLAVAFTLAGYACAFAWHRLVAFEIENRYLREALDDVESGLFAGVAALVLYVVLRARDTALGRAQAALRTSEGRFHQLFHTMLDGCALHEIVCDPDGRPVDYRFLEVNPAFETMTGLAARDLVGRTVREAIPSIEPWWIETYGRVATTGEPTSFEHGTAALGRVYLVSAFSPVRNQFAVIFEDVTERRHEEEAKRRNQEAVGASEERYRRLAEENAELLVRARRDADAKTRLLQEVNHRVKNNLMSLLGLLRAEERHLGAAAPEGARELLDHVSRWVLSLSEAHSLLTASEWGPVGLDELARQVVHAAVRASAQGRAVTVDVEPLRVRVSSQQATSLALVLNELAQNAVKHSTAGLRPVHIAVRFVVTGRRVAIEFRDDGPGYPADVVEGGRTSVGLYLVRNIVTYDLGGTVELSASPGAVTTIAFDA